MSTKPIYIVPQCDLRFVKAATVLCGSTRLDPINEDQNVIIWEDD